MKNFKEQVFAGYQGWFAIPSNRNLDRWSHWCKAKGKEPSPGFTAFELYPDVSEYHKRSMHKTGYTNLKDGGKALLFDSDCDDVLDVHFRWMKEYDIDGVALQRFLGSLNGKNGEWRNSTAMRMKEIAGKWERMFYVMYDISGHKGQQVEDDIWEDYEDFVKKKLMNSPHYARQDNKPVIAIWGLGFNDRPGNAGKTIELIRKLKNDNCYVVGGVPYRWRDGVHDSKPGWLTAYKNYDMLIPWSVGRYKNVDEVKAHVQSLWKPDKEFCDNEGIDIQRVIYPGFAWSNLKGHQGVQAERKLSRHSQDQVSEAPRNEIPRLAGAFFWGQARLVAQLGVGAFIAMFDEYDEATAIAKAAPHKGRIPTNQYFMTLDEDGETLSSDFYLRLAGEASRMIRAKIAGAEKVPIDAMGYDFYIKGGYRAILGRDPDGGGYVNYFAFFKDRGGTVENFCRELVDNDEFRGRLRRRSARELADELLEQWGRDVSSQERDAIAAQIEDGKLADLAIQMFRDPTYINNHI